MSDAEYGGHFLRRTYGNFTTFARRKYSENMAKIRENMADIWENNGGHVGKYGGHIQLMNYGGHMLN
jgi:hypothetical protein